MDIRSNLSVSEKEVCVKIASGLWKIILSIFYLRVWRGEEMEVAMIDPFRLEVISIGDERIPLSLYQHELTHIKQVKKDGRIKFCIKYLYYNLRYGYRNNPYEIEARKAELNY